MENTLLSVLTMVVQLSTIIRPVGWGGSVGLDEPTHFTKKVCSRVDNVTTVMYTLPVRTREWA